MKDLESNITTEIEQSEQVVKKIGQTESGTHSLEQTLSQTISSNLDVVGSTSKLDDISDGGNEIIQVKFAPALRM